MLNSLVYGRTQAGKNEENLQYIYMLTLGVLYYSIITQLLSRNNLIQLQLLYRPLLLLLVSRCYHVRLKRKLKENDKVMFRHVTSFPEEGVRKIDKIFTDVSHGRN